MSKNNVVGGTELKLYIDSPTTTRPTPRTQPIIFVLDFFTKRSVIRAANIVIVKINSGIKYSKLWRFVI